MYLLTSSSPTGRGDKALFESSPLEFFCEVRCLSFYYKMNGRDIGSLSVYLRSHGQDTLIWTLSGNQGTGWQEGRVQILKAPDNAKVKSLCNIRNTSFDCHDMKT